MNKAILTAIFVLLITLLFSCDNCPNEPEHHTYYLSDEDKDFLPYAGTDTLKFSNYTDSTQIITFVGTIKNYFEKVELGNDCITTRDTLEVLTIDFLGDNDYEINVTIHLYYSNGATTPELINSINNEQYSTLNPSESPTIDSVTFNNKRYYDVYREGLSICNSEYEYEIYYNKEYGILYFVQTGCILWQRVF